MDGGHGGALAWADGLDGLRSPASLGTHVARDVLRPLVSNRPQPRGVLDD